MSDHTLALVPLSTGYHQAPDLLARHRSVDTGLLAEALIYYDRTLITVDNPHHFADLISWLTQQGLSHSQLIDLLQEGTLSVYYYAFTTNPYVEFRNSGLHIHGLYNFQDQKMEQPNSFPDRFLGFEKLVESFASQREFSQFCSALDGKVIEVKAAEIGAHAIDNAWKDFLQPERNALIAQQIVNEIYRIKSLGKAPRVSVEIVREESTHQVRWNIPLDRLPALEADTNIKAAATLPLTAAAEANKYLWSADKLRCDLYLGKPVSVVVGDKLYEAAHAAAKIRNLVNELEVRVDFPDVRRCVNEDKIDFDKVLEIRRKAKKFRQWLQSEGDRDRDAIIAYHQEVANESGFTRVGRRALRMFGCVSGAALGASVVHDHALGAVAGAVIGEGVNEAVKYLFDIGAK